MYQFVVTVWFHLNHLRHSRSMLTNYTSYTVSLIRWTVFLMSSGSWQHRDTEPAWRVLDARAAPFRRRATCHSSPVSDIYCYSVVPHLLSIRIHVWGAVCFRLPLVKLGMDWRVSSSRLTRLLLRSSLPNSTISALAPPSATELVTRRKFPWRPLWHS